MNVETRALVSANSGIAKLYEVTNLDGSNPVVFQGAQNTANYCECSEKTIRRACTGTGVVRAQWRVRVI